MTSFVRPISRIVLACAGVATIAVLVPAARRLTTVTQTWAGTGGNAQHTNVSSVSGKSLGKVLWSTPIDKFPQSAGDSHYAGPIITPKNTVVIPVKTGESDGFQVEAHSGLTGALLYTVPTDYSLAVTTATSWTGVFPIGITNGQLFLAAAGGTVWIKSNVDVASSPLKQYCFYEPMGNIEKDPAAFAPTKISTPITGDGNGDVFYGFRVTSGASASLVKKLGGGGIARTTTAGVSTYVLANTLVPANAKDDCSPEYNTAPAVSNDGKYIYVAIANWTQGINYLVKLDSTTLAPVASVRLVDAANGKDVWICTCSSASPMVAPDNQVFFGVLRNYDQTSHGWMLQFDQNLKQTDSTGKRFPIGAFGWDDTPSVVPSTCCPTYTGKSPYLLLTKYNNYVETGGNGKNKLAILDPKNDNVTKDPIANIPVMNEVQTILGKTCDSQFYPCTSKTSTENPKVPVREWCINSAAIDPSTKAAFVNSEDGHIYRWDLHTNTLQQGTYLEPATGEPYTPTAIGPDGTIYVINDANLLAVVAPTP